MCGRTAQTYRSVRAATQNLDLNHNQNCSRNDNANQDTHSEQDHSTTLDKDTRTVSIDENTEIEELSPTRDNFNLCPGMEATVFVKDEDGVVRKKSKRWGLITKSGTTKNPLPTGNAAHFAALMYNARSETIYLKRTFSNLLSKRRSCLIAADGWFEWKQEVKGKKQPYFVKSKNPIQNYCLFPGLWTEVSTGREDDPLLTSFTILTTDAAPCLKWLHSRMPVCCWSKELATQWLEYPSQSVHEQLLTENTNFSSSSFSWYPVTTEMTNLKFRSEKAITPLKRESVKSFFVTQKSKAQPLKAINSNKDDIKPQRSDFSSETKVKSNNEFRRDLSPVRITSAGEMKKRLADRELKGAIAKKGKQSRGSIASFFSKKK